MKKLLISLTILFSSLFFVNNAKAVTYDKVGKDAVACRNSSDSTCVKRKIINNQIGDKYKYNIYNDDFNDVVVIEYKDDGLYFSTTHVKDIKVLQNSDKSLLLNSAFLLTYNPTSHTIELFLYYNSYSDWLKNGDTGYQSYFSKVNTSLDNKFDFYTSGIQLKPYKNYGAYYIKFTYNTDLSYAVTTPAYKNNYYNTNITSNVSIYGSNITLESSSSSYGSYYYYEYPETISIDYSTTNNTKVVNDKEYILSKDLTINYNVDDYTKYIYLYKKESDDNWSTYNFTTNNTSFTLNVTENTSYIARIVDKSTNEEVYTSTMTVTGINYDEYIQDILNITFTSKNNIVNDKVASVNLTIDYGVIDNNKYIYLYKKLDDSNWTTVNLINNSYIDVLINKNNSIIAQILDKLTYEVVKQSTMTITNIDYDVNISFESEALKDDFGNIYQTNVDIIFNSSNRDLFYYEYRTDNFILDNNEFWVRLDDDKSSIVVQNRDNINIYARIVDKSTDEVVYITTYKITNIINKPNISFKTFNNLSYENGKNYISSIDLTIDYGLIDNSKYIYQYKKETDENWTTVNLFNSSYDININENCNIIARVINKEDESIITISSFTIFNIEKIGASNLDNLNDILNYVNQNNNTSTVFSTFQDVWNEFKNNDKIYIYLMLVVSTSIAILVIKSLK